MAHETEYVFVYGAFLRDCVKYPQIQHLVKTWGRAEMEGKLYQIPTGAALAIEEDAPAPGAAPARIFGELLTFTDLDEALALIDAHEDCRPDNPDNSRMHRKVKEVTVAETGAKVKAYAWVFPKDRFKPKEMYAVHCHGGDWRKFVMMPRYDGYQH